MPRIYVAVAEGIRLDLIEVSLTVSPGRRRSSHSGYDSCSR
jgi:hypothetical protein